MVVVIWRQARANITRRLTGTYDDFQRVGTLYLAGTGGAGCRRPPQRDSGRRETTEAQTYHERRPNEFLGIVYRRPLQKFERESVDDNHHALSFELAIIRPNFMLCYQREDVLKSAATAALNSHPQHGR